MTAGVVELLVGLDRCRIRGFELAGLEFQLKSSDLQQFPD